jgi:Ca2+-binding RTX toxin-like protein
VKGDVENLTLTGSANIRGVGNDLVNTLIGNSGRNSLLGGGGDDRMIGGGGNDFYDIGQAGDVVDESVANSSGIDTVRSTISISLSGPKVLGQVENVDLSGTGRINAAGNGVDNVLRGAAGDNDLMGLGGNDTLTGGFGQDTFVFNAALNARTNVDFITEYRVVDDNIRLENAFMPGLATGTLSAAAFRVGTTAVDASDRIIYNDDTGDVFFDRDGSGAAAKVKFAELDAGLAMSNQEFLVV